MRHHRVTVEFATNGGAHTIGAELAIDRVLLEGE